MSSSDQEFAGAQAPIPSGPSLEEGKKQLTRSRLLGRVSAFIFIIAVIAVFDGLQTLMRHEFNSIDIIPGEELMVSGMLPGGVTSHKDLTIHMEGDPCLRFTPLETYKGFWMGGQMWRAALDADASCTAGRGVVTVVDILPFEDKGKTAFAGKQNPALIFAVNIFADQATRQAADNSIIRRYTGLPAFGIAAAAIICALLAGLGNWLVFSKAEKLLAENGVFFIHGLKVLENTPKSPSPLVGYKVAFAHAGKKFYRNEPVVLYDDHWQAQGRGEVIEVTKIKGFALFPKNGVQPRYGWLLARAEEELD